MNYVTATVFVKEANRVKAEQEADIEEETEVEEDTENNNEEKETTQDTPEKKGSTIDETTGEVVESKAALENESNRQLSVGEVEFTDTQLSDEEIEKHIEKNKLNACRT